MASIHHYRPEVDGLRAVAVTLVLLFHAGFQRFSGGFVGVDIFFVISGFLINGIVVAELETTGTFSFRHFYLRRARRLGPALVVTCGFTFVLGVLIFAPDHFGLLSSSLIAALTSTSNIYLWLQAGYFDDASTVKPLLHTWSLSVEEQFYLIWPALVFLVYRYARAPRRAVVVLISLAFASSLAANLWAQNGLSDTGKLADGQTLIFYWMPFRIFELAIGAAIGWLIDRKIPAIVRELSFLIGFALIAYAVRRFNDKTIFPSLHGLVPCVGAALVIVGAQERLGILLRNRIAVSVGLISYSLYLIHWPLIVFWSYLEFRPLTVIDRVGLLAVSVALATLMYCYVEAPFRRTGQRSSRNFISGLATAATALVLIAIPAQGGWAWRASNAAILQSANSVYGGTDCPGLTCSHGTEDPIVYVVGDSFSRHLYAGLTKDFPNQHFEFIDEETCTTFSLKWSWWLEDKPNQQRDCRRERDIVNKRIAGNKVIFSYHWLRFDYFDLDGPAPMKAAKRFWPDYGALGEFIYSQVSELKNTLHLDSVLIVANPPSIGDEIGDMSKCLGRPLASLAGNCREIPEASVDLRRYVAKHFDDHGDVEVIDPFEALCNASSCINYDERGLYYSDKYHLSRLGSQILIDHFKLRIAQWMHAPPG